MVAVEFGFSAQEAFTRAFQAVWSIVPGAWRRKATALTLVTRRQALFPYSSGGNLTEQEAAAAYIYGVEVPADCSGPVPDGMSLEDIPASAHLVFHPDARTLMDRSVPIDHLLPGKNEPPVETNGNQGSMGMYR
jgi:hypothetical protein